MCPNERAQKVPGRLFRLNGRLFRSDGRLFELLHSPSMKAKFFCRLLIYLMPSDIVCRECTTATRIESWQIYFWCSCKKPTGLYGEFLMSRQPGFKSATFTIYLINASDIFCRECTTATRIESWQIYFWWVLCKNPTERYGCISDALVSGF